MSSTHPSTSRPLPAVRRPATPAPSAYWRVRRIQHRLNGRLSAAEARPPAAVLAD